MHSLTDNVAYTNIYNILRFLWHDHSLGYSVILFRILYTCVNADWLLRLIFTAREISFIWKVQKKHSDFPRKSEVYFFQNDIFQIFLENLWYIFFKKRFLRFKTKKNWNQDTSDFLEKSEIFFSSKKQIRFFWKIWGILFWTFQIKYISLAVKNHHKLLHQVTYSDDRPAGFRTPGSLRVGLRHTIVLHLPPCASLAYNWLNRAVNVEWQNIIYRSEDI